MLEMRHDDFIIFAHILHTPGFCNQVDGFRGAAYEHNLLRLGCTNKTLGLAARGLVCIGGAASKRMGCPMNIRVFMQVKISKPVYHRLRLLRRGGVVEPYDLAPVHPLLQNRKVPPDGIDIERRMGGMRRRRRLVHATRRGCRGLADIVEKVAFSNNRLRGRGV